VLAGCGFLFRFSDPRLEAGWSDLIGARPTGGEDLDPSAVIDILFDQRPCHQGYTCFSNDRCTAKALRADEIFPHLVYLVFDGVSARLTRRLLLHAAVLTRNGKTVLFPGEAGSGKSTLAAALSTRGWSYLSDELAVIDPDSGRVEPFLLPIGLKERSTTPLLPFIPNLASRPLHLRADGQRVRYVMPEALCSEARSRVSAMVFPTFNENHPLQWAPLTHLASLERLAATGSSERPLRSNDIECLMGLAQGPSAAVVYSELAAAVELIEEWISTI
jgi:hypothetical protein